MPKYISSVVLLIILSISTIACEKSNIAPLADGKPSKVLLKISAPDTVYLPAKLLITIQLSNISSEVIELMESTPCTIFRWHIVNAEDKIIQSKPNKLCIQSVAFSTLNAHQSIAQPYQISLNTNHYVANSRYRLIYKFWRYSGQHDFAIK